MSAPPVLPIDPRNPANWRALCQHIEWWLATSRPPSRRRSSIDAIEVPEPLRFLLATRKHTLGLTFRQVQEIGQWRSQMAVLWWGSVAGEGWSLRTHRGQPVWRERLAELEAARG